MHVRSALVAILMLPVGVLIAFIAMRSLGMNSNLMSLGGIAIGFRVEHPQTLIDRARFGLNAGNEVLGAADYKLVHHCKNGVPQAWAQAIGRSASRRPLEVTQQSALVVQPLGTAEVARTPVWLTVNVKPDIGPTPAA